MGLKSTMFDHKIIHKQTWIANDPLTINLIVYIEINAKIFNEKWANIEEKSDQK